jgi:hypothetical protein
MDWNHYRFRCSWRLEAEAAAVFGVLERPDEYPAWWPQIREVRRTSDTTGVLRMRSRLPYDLVVTARSVRHDPGAGVLEVALRGDLDGWVRWTVRPGPVGRRRSWTTRRMSSSPSRSCACWPSPAGPSSASTTP